MSKYKLEFWEIFEWAIFIEFGISGGRLARRQNIFNQKNLKIYLQKKIYRRKCDNRIIRQKPKKAVNLPDVAALLPSMRSLILYFYYIRSPLWLLRTMSRRGIWPSILLYQFYGGVNSMAFKSSSSESQVLLVAHDPKRN